MKSETVDAIHDMTLKARALLLTEISEQLEGLYGFLPNGQCKPSDEYPVLASNLEAAETRRHLETLLADELQAGLTAQQAREKLVKEAAFTWLNRLVAFKMMEARRLLRQTVTRGHDSNGFKMWLTEQGNEEHYRDYEAGGLPQDGLGEGPRQRAYRRFLLAQCARLAQEVRVLFEPDNLPSRFCPRPRALSQLIDLLNDTQLQEAWQPGNEETIGWVYQAFNEPDLEVFRGESAAKVPSHLVAAKTQKFTPRWVVKYLVENTLGRMWVEMHSDSNLINSLEYLVPVAVGRNAPLKSVREITLLDPACGTMHFGLVAFDLFVQMYREEMARAGQPGWPEKPPIQSEDQIPTAIIAHNLYGIDIDLRAVQLSALTLYLKAKILNPQASLTESRLACADIHMLNGERLKQFLQTAGLDQRPIYGRILHALQDSLQHAEQLGSLLRLDQHIRELVEKERERYEREGRLPDLFGWSRGQFETEAGRREFWEILEIQIRQALDAFARQQAAEGRDYSFFTGEATKGLQFLEIISRQYDIVATNPPYLDSGDMNLDLRRFIERHYNDSKRNLYSAFVERCLEFVAPGGRIGILTGQTFMFISTFEKFRKTIRRQCKIETLAQFDYGLFGGIRVDTAAFVLLQEPNELIRTGSAGTYFRLVKEPDGDAKRRRFEQAIANLRTGQSDPIVYHYCQGDFDAIPSSPWVYWITSGVKHLFLKNPALGDLAPVCIGMRTGDNRRFLRYWWEVGLRAINRSARNADDALAASKRWFPYMKGGGFTRWYGNQSIVVEWYRNGEVIKENTKHNYPQLGENLGWKISNEQYYFSEGVTYSYLTSGRFSARLSPRGFIFDVAGSSVFPSDLPLVLAVLNSTLGAYALRLINPTVNYQVGDVARLPLPESSTSQLTRLVQQAIDLAQATSCEEECSYDFVAPPAWPAGRQGTAVRHAMLDDIEDRINDVVYDLYGISDEERSTIEAELAESTTAPDASNDNDDGEAGSDEDDGETAQVQLTCNELACQWISYAIGIVMSRFQPGIDGELGRGHFAEDIAAKLRASADSDGIVVLDQGHPDDIAAKVLQALHLMLGEEAATEVVAEGTGRSGKPEEELRRYLERTFFKEHIQKHRKRPVYWLLQSPRKEYGVWLFHEKLTKDTLYRIRGE